MDDEIINQMIKLTNKHRQRDEQLLKKIGLHAGQEHILFYLWQEEGLTPTQLAARSNVGMATIMKTIQRMEQTGLLRRSSDPTDGRASRIYLTERGRSLYAPARQINNALAERTMHGMSDVEKVLFRRFIQQALANLNAEDDMQ